MTSTKQSDPTDSFRIAADDFARHVEDAAEDLADHVEFAADELADRLDHVSGELVSAKQRMKREFSRVGEAFREFSKDAEQPATRVARALDDLTYEARRSFDRITGKPRPSFWTKMKFWL